MNKNLMVVFGLSLLFNSFIVLAYYLSVAPNGTKFFLFISPFAMLPMLAAFLLILVALVLLFWRRYRIMALTVFLGCMIYLIVSFAAISLSNGIRRSEFVKLAQRSRPLISAIQQFEAKYEKPPANLEQLVPEFLPAVPRTGIAAYPNYEYVVTKDRPTYEGNSWVLMVDASRGALNFDAFLYFPKQNYPEVVLDGIPEPIEDWAYVHE